MEIRKSSLFYPTIINSHSYAMYYEVQ